MNVKCLCQSIGRKVINNLHKKPALLISKTYNGYKFSQTMYAIMQQQTDSELSLTFTHHELPVKILNVKKVYLYNNNIAFLIYEF